MLSPPSPTSNSVPRDGISVVVAAAAVVVVVVAAAAEEEDDDDVEVDVVVAAALLLLLLPPIGGSLPPSLVEVGRTSPPPRDVSFMVICVCVCGLPEGVKMQILMPFCNSL